jgi:hypothetical protein
MTEPPTEAAETPEPGDDGKPAEPPRRRILVAVGARTIEVEGPDELDAIVFTAERMWALALAASEPKMWSGGIGFAAELAAPPPSGMPDEEDARRPDAS